MLGEPAALDEEAAIDGAVPLAATAAAAAAAAFFFCFFRAFLLIVWTCGAADGAAAAGAIGAPGGCFLACFAGRSAAGAALSLRLASKSDANETPLMLLLRSATTCLV